MISVLPAKSMAFRRLNFAPIQQLADQARRNSALRALAMRNLLLAARFHHDQPALRAGHAATNSKQIPLRIHQINTQVL